MLTKVALHKQSGANRQLMNRRWSENSVISESIISTLPHRHKAPTSPLSYIYIHGRVLKPARTSALCATKRGPHCWKDGWSQSIKVTRKWEGQSWNHMASLKHSSGRLCVRRPGGRCGGEKRLSPYCALLERGPPGGERAHTHTENTHMGGQKASCCCDVANGAICAP